MASRDASHGVQGGHQRQTERERDLDHSPTRHPPPPPPVPAAARIAPVPMPTSTNVPYASAAYFCQLPMQELPSCVPVLPARPEAPRDPTWERDYANMGGAI